MNPAKRFFEKALRSPPTEFPEALVVDRAPAYPRALILLKHEGYLGPGVHLVMGRWLNNRIEQDHRRIKRLVRPGLGFKAFPCARRMIQGYEVMSLVRKGPVQGAARADGKAISHLVEELFGIAA